MGNGESTSKYNEISNCNPGQNIWHKVKKSSKNGQDFKNLLSNFAYFFDSYYKILISGWKTGH